MPLIYGDFANDSVTVHGTLSVGNPATGTSYYSFPNMDGTSNQVLQTNGAGNLSWTTSSSDTLPLIQDADRDTKIQVETNPDEDIIRFTTTGTEYLNMTNGRINVTNTGKSLFIGEGAGLNDDLSNNNNILLGDSAGTRIINSFNNIGIGINALKSYAVGGANNTVIGHNTMAANTAGSGNVALGNYLSLIHI